MYKKLEKLLDRAHIAITQNCTHHHGRFTVVELTDSKGHTGVGVARRSEMDSICEQKGELIARGRAEKSLFHYLNNKPIRHQFMG
jgi:hypothetical protein